VVVWSAGHHLDHLISLLSSTYWTVATELDDSVNGFTLTRGLFTQQLQVEYATGQSIYTTTTTAATATITTTAPV